MRRLKKNTFIVASVFVLIVRALFKRSERAYLHIRSSINYTTWMA